MSLRRFASDRAATLVEYAVLVAVIVVPVVPALAFLEGGLGTSFETQAAAMSSDVPSDAGSPTSSTTSTTTSTSTTTTSTTTTTTLPNQPPTADFDFSCERLECSFTDRSEDDRGIASREWVIDGTASTPDPTHTFAGPGTHTVQLTVTDTDQVTAVATKSMDIPAVSIELVGSGTRSGNSDNRTYLVTVSATDTHGQVTPGATVTGSWSNEGTAGVCVTEADGTCTVRLDVKMTNPGPRTFTVTGVSHWAWGGALPGPVSVPQPNK